jgi:hypothetical protein
LTPSLSLTNCTIPLLAFVCDPFSRSDIMLELFIYEFKVLNHFLALRSHVIAQLLGHLSSKSCKTTTPRVSK